MSLSSLEVSVALDAIVERLAADGMGSRSLPAPRSEVTDVAQAIGGVPLVLDVTDHSAVATAVDLVEREIGPIALLVDNAATLEPAGPGWDREPENWWRVFEVNVLAPFLFARSIMPRMVERGRGRVVNLASQSAYAPIDESPAYHTW